MEWALPFGVTLNTNAAAAGGMVRTGQLRQLFHVQRHAIHGHNRQRPKLPLPQQVMVPFLMKSEAASGYDTGSSTNACDQD
jgi:hypothetical protein